MLNIPSPQPYYIINDITRIALEYVATRQDKGEISNILVLGPTGTGKSTLGREYAAARQLPFASIEIGIISDPSQIFGSMVLRNSATVYQPSLFTKALQTPNCVIHLQELNRIESDKTLNAIFSILDEAQRSLWVDDLEAEIKVADGVVFFASMNEGFEFTGTTQLDTALRNRFELKVSTSNLPADEEMVLLGSMGLSLSQQNETIRIVEQLRSNTQNPIEISTRTIVELGRLIIGNIGIVDALHLLLGDTKEVMETIILSLELQGVSIPKMIKSHHRLAPSMFEVLPKTITEMHKSHEKLETY